MTYFLEHQPGTKDYKLWWRTNPNHSFFNHDEEQFSLLATLNFNSAGRGKWKVARNEERAKKIPASSIGTVVQGEMNPIDGLQGNHILFRLKSEKPATVLQYFEKLRGGPSNDYMIRLARLVKHETTKNEIVMEAMLRGDLTKRDYFIGRFIDDYLGDLSPGAGDDQSGYVRNCEHFLTEAVAAGAKQFRITPAEAERMYTKCQESHTRDFDYPQLPLQLGFKDGEQ